MRAKNRNWDCWMYATVDIAGEDLVFPISNGWFYSL
jgi:hypothetical protein